MNKEELAIVREALGCLKGEKLQYVMRAGSMGDLGLGDIVDTERHIRDKNGKLVLGIRKLPKYALHIDGRFRMTCGDEIVLSKDDMFNPPTKKENEPGFDWKRWATDEEESWDMVGNNRYDEICERYFKGELSKFIVKKVTVSRWGDLKIAFENGFVLENFVDVSGSNECWRFFVRNDMKSHIVVTGNGLEESYKVDEQKYKELIYAVDDRFEKDPMIIYWANGLVVRCKSFTGMYETDTGPGEADYIGAYAAAVNEVEVLEQGRDDSVGIYEGAIEISLVNIPEKIMLTDGTVLWQREAQ